MDKSDKCACADVGSLSESRMKACLSHLKCIVLNLVKGLFYAVYNLLFWTFAFQIFLKVHLNFPCTHVSELPATMAIVNCYEIPVERFKLVAAQSVFNWCIALVLHSLHSLINFVLFFFFLRSFLFALILLRLLLVEKQAHAAGDNEWKEKC